MYKATSADGVHLEKKRQISSKMNARKKIMSLLHYTMVEILRPPANAVSASFHVYGLGKHYVIAF